MKILVLSDSHGCRDRLRAIVEACAPVVDAVIFCGDGERDWASLNDLQCLRHKQCIAVAGNCDTMSMNPRTSYDEIGGYKFYTTHGHFQFVKQGLDYIAMDAMKDGRQVVCFGHTHDQYCGQWGDVFLFNPGAVLSDCYGSIHIHDHSNGITFRHWYWNDGDATLHDEYHFQGPKTTN